jgi:hypothetical protein
MTRVSKLAFAAAAVVGLVLPVSACTSTASVGGQGSGGPSPAPSASVIESPSTATSATSSPLPSVLRMTDTSNWQVFKSARYRYQMGHPSTWSVTAADRDWSLRTSRLDYLTSAADQFIDPGATFQVLVTAFADDVPSGTSVEEWIKAYYEGSPQGCGALSEDIRPISVDGNPGRLVVADPCSDAQAFVFFGGRVHVFAVWRDNQEALLEAFLSTVKFAS